MFGVFSPFLEPQVPSPRSSQPRPRRKRLQSRAAPGGSASTERPSLQGAGLPANEMGPDPAPHSPGLPKPFTRSPVLSPSHIVSPTDAPEPADPPQRRPPVSLLRSHTFSPPPNPKKPSFLPMPSPCISRGGHQAQDPPTQAPQKWSSQEHQGSFWPQMLGKTDLAHQERFRAQTGKRQLLGNVISCKNLLNVC